MKKDLQLSKVCVSLHQQMKRDMKKSTIISIVGLTLAVVLVVMSVMLINNSFSADFGQIVQK